MGGRQLKKDLVVTTFEKAFFKKVMLLKKGDSCGEQVSQDQRPCRHQHKENKVESFFSDIAGKGKTRKKEIFFDTCYG